jgi:predicted ABC-type ATPase
MNKKRISQNVYVIAGPNGAGKTTFAREFLPHYVECIEFVNADLIAGGLSPFDPSRAAIHAGRIMLEEIHSLSEGRKDFGFETTLSGRTQIDLLRRLKQRGYRIHIFFLWIPNSELALERIKSRVEEGGHDIPETTVRRRFDRSLSNFMSIYRDLADAWAIFDNSSEIPVLIAFKELGELTVFDEERYAIITMPGEGGAHEKSK